VASRPGGSREHDFTSVRPESDGRTFFEIVTADSRSVVSFVSKGAGGSRTHGGGFAILGRLCPFCATGGAVVYRPVYGCRLGVFALGGVLRVGLAWLSWAKLDIFAATHTRFAGDAARRMLCRARSPGRMPGVRLRLDAARCRCEQVAVGVRSEACCRARMPGHSDRPGPWMAHERTPTRVVPALRMRAQCREPDGPARTATRNEWSAGRAAGETAGRAERGGRSEGQDARERRPPRDAREQTPGGANEWRAGCP